MKKMPEQGFEMIRGRRKQIVERTDSVPDQTKSVRKSQTMKTYNIFNEDKPNQKRNKAKESIGSPVVRKKPPVKKVREDTLQVFVSPEKRQDAPLSERRSQKADMSPLAAMRYRALKNARDTLLALTDQDEDGISVKEQMEIADLVEKHTEIVEKLRLKWNKAITNSGEEEDNSHVDGDRDATGHKVIGEEVRKTKRKRVATRTQSSSPGSSPEHMSRHSRTPPPTRRFGKSKKYTPPPPSPNIAFPASVPTTLPVELRTRKDLTADEILEKTKIHPSFDESTGKKIDKHNRRINCTSGKGMVAGMKSNPGESQHRTLKEQIRVPSDSPESDISDP